jgi:glutaredoxin 2
MHVLGAKGVVYNPVWLRNDDAKTPTALVGKKMVPIFQPNGESGPSVGESMEICRAVDSDPGFGPVGMFRAMSGRTDFADWFMENAMTLRRLTRPRHANAPLPEFMFESAREAYVKNHPLPEPSTYAENMSNSPALVAELNSKLGALNELIFCEQYCSKGGLSFDDVDLFGRIRSFTIIRDLAMPAKLEAYIRFQAALGEVPLYDCYAS